MSISQELLSSEKGRSEDCAPSQERSSEERRKLRVLVYLFFPGSGLGRYTHELMRHFESTKLVESKLVCLPSYHWREEADYAVWPNLFEIGHRIPWRRRARFLAGQVLNPARLTRHVREFQADVVHLSVINHLTFPFWRRLMDRTGVKIVATAHDVRRGKAVIHRGYEDRQLQAFYRRADALFVHSAAQVEDLIDFPNVQRSRIHIVPHGPYDYGVPRSPRTELRSKYGWPVNKQLALFFGNIRDDKNLELLIRAMRHHRDRVHLAVVGRSGGGPHRGIDEYKRIAREAGVEASISFDDRYVPDAEIPDLFEASDWAALPYSREFTSQSGVLNIAARYRRAMLLSASGTLEETFRQHDLGVLVTPDDENALTAGIKTMIDRVDSGSDYEFDSYLEHFSWEQNIRKTVEVYQEIVGV